MTQSMVMVQTTTGFVPGGYVGTNTSATAADQFGNVAGLIHAARLGDDSAFCDLVDLYQSAAQRVARRILRTEEAAADAVQDALIKAHRAMPRFQDGNFNAWLMRIVTNTCYDHLRRQKRRPTVSLDDLVEPNGYFQPSGLPFPTGPNGNPEQVAVQREEMRMLMAAIEGLPGYHRNVVVLVDVYGYDYQEAAAMLQLPLGTVKSRLSRARASLRDQLVSAGLVPDRAKIQA